MTGATHPYLPSALRWNLLCGLLRVWLLTRRSERSGGVKFHPHLSEQHRSLRMRYTALAKHHRAFGHAKRATYLERRARWHAAQAILHARWGSATDRRRPRPCKDHGPDALVPVQPRPRPPTPLAAAAAADQEESTHLDLDAFGTLRTRWFRVERTVEQGHEAVETRASWR